MASSIHHLNADDFSIENGKLVTAVRGLSLVLFYKRAGCKYSAEYYPRFTDLPNRIRGVTFAVVNVDDNMTLVARSKQTSTPINHVPKMLLFTEGLPYVEYTKKPFANDGVISFLTEISNSLNQQRRASQPPSYQTSLQAPQPHQQPQRPPPSNNTINGGGGGYHPSQQQPQRPFPPPPPPSSMQHPGQGQGPVGGQPYRITPGSGVKEYERSYGRPYNTASETDYLEEEAAYRK